jgi:glycosyltransferase involved in cell wall biosynthesis
MSDTAEKSARVSVIVPARNEEAVIAACVNSLLPQPEIAELLVIDDQSTDRTAAVVQELTQNHRKLRLLSLKELPAGWVGKNNAVWRGAREANGEWLLFTDADAVHEADSAQRALTVAAQQDAALVSFSPEQVMQSWYERALIPYVYCRLASRFSYAEVNDVKKSAAAANGQFLMIRRDVYNAVGGHASVADEVLEDVALATRVKRAGYRIWFGSGQRVVRVRMYRSFRAMCEGWKKNLYPLMGGNAEGVSRELFRAIGPVLAMLVAAISTWGLTENWFASLAVLAAGFVAIALASDDELRRSHFAHHLGWYGVPGRLLFARVLWASSREYRKGKLTWKGREYPVPASRASNG